MSAEMTYEELATLIKNSTGLPIQADELRNTSSTFTELDMDDLSLMALVAELENKYGINVDPEKLANLTGSGVLEVINSALKAKV